MNGGAELAISPLIISPESRFCSWVNRLHVAKPYLSVVLQVLREVPRMRPVLSLFRGLKSGER